MHFQVTVVFDETQFSEFVHEETHTRPSCTDHIRQRLWLIFSVIGSGLPSLPKFAKRRGARCRGDERAGIIERV
jgi:hypothetical protein